MAGFKCPYCNEFMVENNSTIRYRDTHFWGAYESDDGSAVRITYCKCPNCNNFTIYALGIGENVKKIDTLILPQSNAMQFPDYIPEQIRQDYEEAYSIVYLSPKASATLARRCLQGMIRDFWGIHDRKNLSQEIDAINKHVSPSTWKAINAVRQIGNIGAHMEHDINLIVDIDPGEAETLLKLIEYLIKEWYISRNDSEELLSKVAEINAEKQAVIQGD